MQCAPDSARWPLLQFGPETLFFSEAECFSLPHPVPYPQSRSSLLAQLEQDLARGRSIDAPFWTVPAGCEAFFEMVRLRALEAGGLRVYADSASAPVEAIASDTASWSERFAIVRAARAPLPERLVEPVSDVLIYCNPAGEPLPEARKEAEAMLVRYAGKARAFFRPMGREELDSHIASSSLILYFGHARLIDGHPAIPTGSSWMPLIARAAGPLASKCFVLAACLEDGARFQAPGGLFIHPVSRLADRPCGFLNDFLATWEASGDLAGAWLKACRQDAERKDVRRFVYRMQGNIWL